MRLINPNQEKEAFEFAERAARAFLDDEKMCSYTDDGNIERGQYLALRWGLDNGCVLVLKIDDGFEPRVYEQMAQKVAKGHVAIMPVKITRHLPVEYD